MRCVPTMAVGIILAASSIHAESVPAIDTDRDGLSEVREQALLDRFVPRLQMSGKDCAVKPALFAEGLAKLTVLGRMARLESFHCE